MLRDKWSQGQLATLISNVDFKILNFFKQMFLVNLLFYLSSGISQGRLMNFCKALQLLMIPLISNTVVKHLHMYSSVQKINFC